MKIFSVHVRGSFVAIAAVLSVVMSVFALFMARLQSSSRNQSVYISLMNQAYQTAESGMREATGKIIVAPEDFADMNGVAVPFGKGEYTNQVIKNNAVVAGGYYILTTATVAAHGQSFTCKLHTHVRVSNVSDYFAAISDRLDILDGADISQGRVYSPILNFQDTTAAVTRVKSAQFVADCTPPIDWSAGTKAQIVVSEPVYPTEVNDLAKANQPVKLTVPIVFPQVTQDDLDRYKNLAGVHTTVSTFVGEIFPPGYKDAGGGCTPIAGDTYANHTCINAEHVYYSVADMHIKGIVHGQVLFVSEGDIYISGDLLSANAGDPLPGMGYVSSSTAHQAILITRRNVIINNTFYTGGGMPQEQQIQGLIMAPHGELRATPYAAGDTVHNQLSLRFQGSMILGHLGTGANALSAVFKVLNGRIYIYMQSLKSNPPPYLTAILDIYASLEETASGSIY